MSDTFARTRALFELPDGVIYLDGNSLGPLPRAARQRVAKEIDIGWGRQLIRAWNESAWIDLPDRVGDKIAGLIGAPRGSVVAGDSTSVNLHKALAAALSLTERKVILSDNGNFPTDLYVAQGIVAALGRGHELKVVAPEEVDAAIDDRVAVLMLTQVDYRTGRLHDMTTLTAKAHAAGVLTIWDLAHSAGALPVDLTAVNADFAIGCGYKYLNGGPGAPAFIHVRPDLQERIAPVLSGWLGHDAPFLFDPVYKPGAGIARMRVGTPPILSMAALDAALEAFDGVAMADIRARSIELTELFVAEIEAAFPDLVLASARDPQQRGSQISFRFQEGYSAMQACIAAGVIGDFRAPDIMRFGFAPLYISADDVREAARRIGRVMAERQWERAEFRVRAKVT